MFKRSNVHRPPIHFSLSRSTKDFNSQYPTIFERYELRKHTLAKHGDDAAPFTHRNKSNDQPRDELRFQTRILTNREAMKANESQNTMFERAREKKRAKERFCLIWRNKNRYSQSTDHTFHCGLKSGLQTDRQTN